MFLTNFKFFSIYVKNDVGILMMIVLNLYIVLFFKVFY